jgi:glutathione S-transferase
MTLTLYQLPPSPNNIKVRVACGIKGIEVETVDFGLNVDRSQVIEVSGQPLTPTIKHGDVVLFGSAAILRYIDANFREGPRLFSETQEGMRKIEEWESWANDTFSQAMILVARQFFAGQDDPAATQKANDLLRELAPKIEAALEGNEFLMGATPTAADVTLFPWVSYTAVDPAQAPAGSPPAFFAERIQLPAELTKTRAWLAKMAAFDKA